MRQPKQSRRGLTLIEAVITMLVLTTGVAALFSMLTQVSGAQRSLELSARATDLHAQLASELRDAQCDFQATNPPGPFFQDPALTIPPGVWFPNCVSGIAGTPGEAGGCPIGPAPVFPGSKVRTVGAFVGETPPLVVSYRVRPVLAARSGAAPVSQIRSFEIDIRVREITAEAARNANPNREDGYWIKIFTMEKLCTARIDDPVPGQSGRGEFL